MLYEAFDKFLQIDTWHTRHPNDEERFFKVLASVIEDSSFNPDNLGAYIREKKGVPRDEKENHFNIAIDDYVTKAWAVKDYLKANRL
jgi:hypothetical protein